MLLGINENTVTRRTNTVVEYNYGRRYLLSVIKINMTLFSSETVERIHDGSPGLFTIYDNGFSKTFFAPYPCNALCRLKVTTRYKYGAYNILVCRAFLF